MTGSLYSTLKPSFKPYIFQQTGSNAFHGPTRPIQGNNKFHLTNDFFKQNARTAGAVVGLAAAGVVSGAAALAAAPVLVIAGAALGVGSAVAVGFSWIFGG